LTDRRTISIRCRKCRTLLYTYRKGGTGALVKCFVERIVDDHTAGDLRCPGCGQQFARERDISGKPAHKIIGGKVFTRGMRRR
jgi:ribosomal protein S27E